MSDGKPGGRPGTPSPFKKFWVIEIQGALVRLNGIRGLIQLPKGPTPFDSEKSAMNACRHIFVGEIHIPILHVVTRQWLESVAKGDILAKVQVYSPESRGGF